MHVESTFTFYDEEGTAIYEDKQIYRLSDSNAYAQIIFEGDIYGELIICNSREYRKDPETGYNWVEFPLETNIITLDKWASYLTESYNISSQHKYLGTETIDSTKTHHLSYSYSPEAIIEYWILISQKYYIEKDSHLYSHYHQH